MSEPYIKDLTTDELLDHLREGSQDGWAGSEIAETQQIWWNLDRECKAGNLPKEWAISGLKRALVDAENRQGELEEAKDKIIAGLEAEVAKLKAAFLGADEARQRYKSVMIAARSLLEQAGVKSPRRPADTGA